MIPGFLQRILEVLIPTRCRVCQLVGPAVYCEDCISQLEQVGDPRCMRCGRRRQTSFASPDCAECSGVDTGVTRVRSMFIYNKAAAKALAEFKFKGQTGVGEKLAELVADWPGEGIAKLYAEPDLSISGVVPVPLHKNRLRHRKFNQSLLISRHIAEAHGLACYPDLLLRVKNTETQVGLSTYQRFNNVKGAFKVNPERKSLLNGRNLLLVDDLMTTGATLAACAKVLRRGGAGMVFGMTVFSTHRELTPSANPG